MTKHHTPIYRHTRGTNNELTFHETSNVAASLRYSTFVRAVLTVLCINLDSIQAIPHTWETLTNQTLQYTKAPCVYTTVALLAHR